MPAVGSCFGIGSEGCHYVRLGMMCKLVRHEICQRGIENTDNFASASPKIFSRFGSDKPITEVSTSLPLVSVLRRMRIVIQHRPGRNEPVPSLRFWQGGELTVKL